MTKLDYVKLFHYVSFLSLPMMVVAIHFVYRPIIAGNANSTSDVTTGLYLLGVGLSFGSLIDVQRKTKVGTWLYANPRRGKMMLLLATTMILLGLGTGLTGIFRANAGVGRPGLYELSTGLLAVSIGLVSYLRLLLDMIRVYRKPNLDR